MDLLALTQQFNIELTPDQVEKVKSKGMSSPSPPLFPPQTSHSPKPVTKPMGDFSNSWNSLLYPQKGSGSHKQLILEIFIKIVH